ncbi:MAG TPA: ATP-binding cassette domain-containing protein [Solirubrobacteraceae bacterium]|nr:ATP-binding cassette domain-containing protein [Solirubrobacteraceae bacterium]
MSSQVRLALEKVSKSYWRGPHETAVLKEISLSVHAGECVAVWGQRGSGKTTLLKVAAGLEAPECGTVRFKEQDLGGMSRAALVRLLREEIGWARRAGPESDELEMLDYVALPLLKRQTLRRARRRSAAALSRVGVGECSKGRWEDLTDGERTLVSIAHAMVRQPSLLVVDDPTANLDVLQREEVMGLLRSTAEQDWLGVLITVPDMPSMVHAHRIGSLSDGRLLVPSGTLPERDNVVEFPAGGRAVSG